MTYLTQLQPHPKHAAEEQQNEGQEKQLTNIDGEIVEALRLREIPGCIIHDNLGMGAPFSWKREDMNRIIGKLEYRVESWTDTKIQRPVLIVYQYPTGESGYGTRTE